MLSILEEHPHLYWFLKTILISVLPENALVIVRTWSSMVGFTSKGWGGAGESDRGAVFCRWPRAAGWKRATFQKLGESLHALALVRWSSQQTLRNYYVANTGASNRNTMVSKPWSLASDSLGNSKERIPTKNRRGKALRVQNDKQDQSRSPWPGNQRRIHKGSQTSPGGLLGETLSTWTLKRGRFSRMGMLVVMRVGYREKVQTQRQTGTGRCW